MFWTSRFIHRAHIAELMIPRCNMAESVWRGLLKAISYRVCGTTLTIIVTWAVSGSLHVGVVSGLSLMLVKVGGFYIHERMWNRIPFGRVADSVEIPCCHRREVPDMGKRYHIILKTKEIAGDDGITAPLK